MNTIAIIPARSGSKGVPDKNIRLLGGHPLISYSIAAAMLCETVDRVLVSTDSAEYAKIAKEYGAEVPFLRPVEFAQDASGDREYFVHAMQWMKDNESVLPEYWVHLRPTTPLRDPAIIDDAVRMIVSESAATALRSGHEAPESPFKWFQLTDDGFFHGIRENDTRNEYYNLPRQAFPPVYIPDGYVDVVRASFILSQDQSLHGERMLGYVSPFCTEVDTLNEFELLEYQLARTGSPLLNYLNEIKR